MKIIVIGGSGLIGSKLVNSFRGNGEEVIPACPSNGVDTITGAVLAQMLAGARVVVDVANVPSFDDQHVIEAEATAGVGHHIALSIVGIDRNPEIDYFRAKMAQESLIKASGIPYTIVRSTQLFESIGYVAQASAVGETVHVSPALVQPIASDDVVAVLADAALGAPMNGTIEVAGPEQLPLDEFIEKYLISHHDKRQVIGNVHARYFGLELNDKSLTPGDKPRIGPTRFDDWLRRQPTLNY
jgi:uncharacterized protein YbjT (DUF2867 family)